MTDYIGQQLGNYRLTHLLGQGGFAEVYLGQHVYLKTQAAVKVLHTRMTQEQITGFMQEAQVIAGLVHPNIVRVLDFAVADKGLPFLVMDYCPNGTLRSCHVNSGPLPLATVLSYVEQVAAALQYAHDHKLIHRDVKPENMLIGPQNQILLSDFGIAASAHNTSSMSTQIPVGTIPYMAPEQIQAQARPASDQYALGIVAYEWLTGERPFSGSYTEIFAKHLMTPPRPLREKIPTLPLPVEEVVLKALTKDPHQRFASMQAFATALLQAGQARSSTLLTGGSVASIPPTQSASGILAPTALATPAPQSSPPAFVEERLVNMPPTALPGKGAIQTDHVASTPPSVFPGTSLPMSNARPARGITLKASLIAGAIAIGYVLLSNDLPTIYPYISADQTTSAYQIVDGLVSMLICFFTAFLVAKRTGRVAPGLTIALWVTFGFGIVLIPNASTISNITYFRTYFLPLFSTGFIMDALIVGLLGLLGAWLGGLIGRRGVQVMDNVGLVGQSAPLPGLGTLVRVFSSVSAGKAIGISLGVIVFSIFLLVLLTFGLHMGGPQLFLGVVTAVISSIVYMVRATSRQGQTLILYTNGIILHTPQGPLGVRWHEIAQVPTQANKDVLITTLGMRIMLPSTIEGMNDLRAAIQTGVAQVRVQGGQVTPS